MKRPLIGLVTAAVLATGCSSADGPKNGVVNFQLAANCPAFNEQLSWSFFADGNPLGSPQMMSGQSASYLLAPGTHTVRWKWNNALHPIDVTSAAFPLEANQRIDVNIECVTQ